jgi:DNA-binding CsgD family transcriptional regulator/chromosome segregation and condensation protein ScpB
MGKWPLTGRQAEVERLNGILAGEGRAGVVLAGPPGVGKTRLANECLDLAVTREYATARSVASRAAAGIPLGALATLLPEVRSAGGPADLLRWARAEIAKLGGGRRLALLVDDVHLLDDTSAALVGQVALAGDAFVVATLRSGEPAPDAVVQLWKNDLVERVEVRPLEEASIAGLLVAALGGPVEAGTSHRLASASAGNILYLRELVLAALDARALEKKGGIWRLVGELPMSNRLVELVELTLGRLSDHERAVLDMLAYGEPLGVAMLEAAHGAGVLEVLEARRLVEVTSEGRRLDARLAHPLYADVLRAGAPALRARAARRALADSLEATGARRREDRLRHATWRIHSGGNVDAAVMLEAAERARQLWDLALAERLASTAAEQGAGFGARLLLGQLAMLQGRPHEADDLFRSLADQAADDAQRAALASLRIHNLLIGLGRPADAVAVADAAAAAISDPHWNDHVRIAGASALFLAGFTRRCLEVVDPVLHRVRGVNLINACSIASVAMTQAGRLHEALEVGARAQAAHLAEPASSVALPASSHVIARGVALANLGRLAEAQDLADREHQSASRTGSVDAQANVALLRCWVLLLQGRVASAAGDAAEAAALFRSLQWPSYLRFSLAHLAHARALGGDAEGAAAALAELDALGIPDTDACGALVMESRAWVAIAAGDHRGGRTLLVDAADLGADRGDLTLEASALHSLARTGDMTAVKRLASVAADVDGDLVQARLRHSLALAEDDLSGLMEVSGSFEHMGALLYAAEAAAGAAVSSRRAGRMRQAAAIERRAATLARHCQGAMTSALVRIETQALLTARELEVAGLAAAGSSNREIAQHLHVSVRTVETQLQRVYEKLGVHRRDELPEALRL